MPFRVAPLLSLLALAGCAGPTLLWRGRSPDRTRRAVLEETDGRQRMEVQGGGVTRWDEVSVEHVRWTPLGLLYPARVGTRWHLVVDGRPGPAHGGIGFVRAFADHIAYAAIDADRWRVVLDGAPGPVFTSLRADTVRTQEGRIVYIGRDRGGEHAVVDQHVGPAFDLVRGLQLGAKGQLVVYAGYDEAGAHLMVDGAPVAEIYEDVLEIGIATARPQWAAIVTSGGHVQVVRGSRGGGLEHVLDDRAAGRSAVELSQLTLSTDGVHVAWVSATEGGQEVYLDGARVGSHPAVERLRFVPRTGALSYVARTDRGVRVVHGAAVSPRFDEVEGPVVSDAGGFGYVGIRSAGCAVVVDGALVFRGEWAGGLALASQTRRFAFLMRRAGRRFVVTQDARDELPPPLVDTLVLSADGTHYGVVVADPESRRIEVVVDGHVVAPLDIDEMGSLTMHAEARDLTAIVRGVVAAELGRATSGDTSRPINPRSPARAGGRGR